MKKIVGGGEEIVVLGNMEVIESQKAVISEAGTQGIIQILASIYSDPVKAVIREYATNAVDAHVEVGKTDVPIQIKLPTEGDPVFMVRDFGRGLSRRGMMNIFKNVGTSTKTNSNELTGGMGIGSKSCFALVNQIIISSITLEEGKKRKGIYSYYKNDDQDICLDLLAEEVTEENTGLEIKVPVGPELCYEFQNKAKGLFKSFKVTPKIVNMDIDCKLPEPFLETPYKDDVRVRALPGTGFNFIMGNIAYEINRAEILKVINRHADILGRWEKLNWLATAQGANVYIDIPIGSIRIAPSRENLFYSLSNIVVMIDYLTKANDLIEDYFHSKLCTITNPLARLTKKAQICKFNLPLSASFHSLIDQSQFLEKSYIKLNASNSVIRTPVTSLDIGSNLANIINGSYHSYRLFYYYDFIVEKPIDKRIINRLIVKTLKGVSVDTMHLVRLAEDSEITALLDGSDNPNIINLSSKLLDEQIMKELQNEIDGDSTDVLDLEAFNAQLTAARKKRSLPTFRYDSEASNHWAETAITPAATGYYVSIYRWNFDYDDLKKPWELANAKKEMDILCGLKLPALKLYGVKRAEVERITKKFTNLKSLKEFYNEWIDVVLNNFEDEFPYEVLRFSKSDDPLLTALRATVVKNHREIMEACPYYLHSWANPSSTRCDVSLAHAYLSWFNKMFSANKSRIDNIEAVLGRPALNPSQVQTFIEIFQRIEYLQIETKNSLIHLSPFKELKDSRVSVNVITNLINCFVPDSWS